MVSESFRFTHFAGSFVCHEKMPLEDEDELKRWYKALNEYEGAFVENYVAQQLVAHFQQDLYYWRSKGGKAELDFLCEFEDRICPLEVKAGINPKSKSLKSYNLQFQPARLMRTNLLNFKKDGKICNLPLYAVSLLPLFVSETG